MCVWSGVAICVRCTYVMVPMWVWKAGMNELVHNVVYVWVRERECEELCEGDVYIPNCVRVCILPVVVCGGVCVCECTWECVCV